MKGLFNCFKNSCFSIHEPKLPMIIRCVEEDFLTLPEGRSDWKLFVDLCYFFKVLVSNHYHGFTHNCNISIRPVNNASNFSIFLEGFLANNLLGSKVILGNCVLCDENDLIFFVRVKNFLYEQVVNPETSYCSSTRQI